MKRTGSKATVIEAQKEIYLARARFYEVFKREFPAGSDIHFWYGNNMRKVTILEWHPGSYRVRVVGATGKPYMINTALLLQ